MAQLQMENQRIVNESLQSKASSDRSLGNEREMRARLEQIEVLTKYNESEHQKASALLDSVKAAKEIESMNVEDFVKIYGLIEQIKANSSIKQEEIVVQNPGVENGTQL